VIVDIVAQLQKNSPTGVGFVKPTKKMENGHLLVPKEQG
jgi:hypothetical protein